MTRALQDVIECDTCGVPGTLAEAEADPGIWHLVNGGETWRCDRCDEMAWAWPLEVAESKREEAVYQ